MRAQLTSSFLEMETKQAAAEVAVQTSTLLYPEGHLARQWEPVKSACYAATEAYLGAMSASGDGMNVGADRFGGPFGQPGAAAFDHTRHMLMTALTEIDRFTTRHRAGLESASRAATTIVAQTEQAKSLTMQARQKLATADPRFAAYPSVAGRAGELDDAFRDLATAADSHQLALMAEASAQVLATIAAIDEALAGAPQREEQARRGISSVMTRLDAARTRAEAMRPAMSALLREFHQNSSAGLNHNEGKAAEHFGRAASLIDEAKVAQREQRPEDALELVSQVRTQLAEADKLVDEVADRLALLRDLRRDPTASEKDVRFKLRDAQRLAVSRGLVGEWGSVLDAQVGRIDRTVGELRGRHPDYWAYHLALQEVSSYIAEVVARMRKQAAQ